MKRIITIIGITLLVIVVLIALRYTPAASKLIWEISNKGTWFLPLVIFSALLDSVHPCSFSILLITIAFLFAMQRSRKTILQTGGVYILGIFIAYLFIGLGILKVLHLFNTPHFMGKLGAAILIAFGLLNIVNAVFPRFPVKLRLPSSTHSAMSELIDRASMPAAFGLGLLVGICQFPCMGGPYLMVIGLLRDRMTYLTGASYLAFYNIILVLPLLAMLFIAANKILIEKFQAWQNRERNRERLIAGFAMMALGVIIFLL